MLPRFPLPRFQSPQFILVTSWSIRSGHEKIPCWRLLGSQFYIKHGVGLIVTWICDISCCRNLVLRERDRQSTAVQRPVTTLSFRLPWFVSSSLLLHLTASETSLSWLHADSYRGRRRRRDGAGHDRRQQRRADQPRSQQGRNPTLTECLGVHRPCQQSTSQIALSLALLVFS